MFGYVRPVVPQLKVMEYEMYRAVYCGLCRAMGNVTGQSSRLTLSYDFTLFAMVRMIVENVLPEFAQFRCIAHPLNRRSMVLENDVLDNAAAVSALLTYLKNRDDLTDEHGLKYTRALLLDRPTASMKKRGERHLPENAADVMTNRLNVLTELEKADCPSLDQTADAFGDVLAYTFSLNLTPGSDAETLASTIGHAVGRFVYVCDAADDLAEDVRHGRYNPLAAGWGPLALGEDGKISPLVRGSLETSLPLDLETLGHAADKLDPSHPFTPIVRNIVYLGLPDAMRRVLDGKPNHQKSFEIPIKNIR